RRFTKAAGVFADRRFSLATSVSRAVTETGDSHGRTNHSAPDRKSGGGAEDRSPGVRTLCKRTGCYLPAGDSGKHASGEQRRDGKSPRYSSRWNRADHEQAF